MFHIAESHKSSLEILIMKYCKRVNFSEVNLYPSPLRSQQLVLKSCQGITTQASTKNKHVKFPAHPARASRSDIKLSILASCSRIANEAA